MLSSALRLPLRKFHTTFPADLVNLSPFPSRCVWRRERYGNVNGAVIKNGLVDPSYQEYDDELWQPVNQGASFWNMDFGFASFIYDWDQRNSFHFHFPQEDPSMIWEVPQGTKVPEQLRLVEHCHHPESQYGYTLQPAAPMRLKELNTMIRALQLEVGNQRNVKRLQDWITPENRFMRQFPFLLRNRPPDEYFRAYAAGGEWKQYG